MLLLFKNIPDEDNHPIQIAEGGELSIDEIGLVESYRERVLGILSEFKEAGIPIKEPKSRVDSSESTDEFLSKFSAEVYRAIEKAPTERVDLILESHRKVILERIILLLERKGILKRHGDHFVVNSDLTKGNIEVRKYLQTTLRRTHTALRKQGLLPKGNSFSTVDMAREIGNHVKILDSEGNEVDLDKLIHVRTIDKADLVPKVSEFLRKHRAKRLWLNYPEELISESEIEERTDNERGFLCIYDREKKAYRKLGREFFDKNLRLSANQFHYLFNNPNSEIRRSDIRVLNFIPRLFSKKNASAVLNGVSYRFPQKPFEIGTTSEQVHIDPKRDTFLKLTDEYALLIINRAGYSKAYQLKLLSRDELLSTPEYKEKFDRYKMVSLPHSATLERLTEWDVTQFIPPHAEEIPQQYARRISRIGNINNLINLYRELIDEADFNLQDYNLKAQLLFASYFNNLPQPKKDRMYELLRLHGREFFETFEACELGLDMGDSIVRILEAHGKEAMPIFKQFASIMHVFAEKEAIMAKLAENSENLGQSFDETRFYTSIAKRGRELLKAFENIAPGENLKQLLTECRQYQSDVVSYGATISAVATTVSQTPTSPEKINQLVRNIQVENLRGGKFLVSGEREAMKSSKNYLQPEHFNEKDYEMIVRNLTRAYKDIDPGWLEHLIDNIPKDLSNPDVKLLLVKNKKGELIGLCKLKRLGENHYYMGTLYVEEEYQKGFGIGQYLDAYLRQGLPEDAKIEATVAAANTAASRHIEGRGWTVDAIVTEGEGRQESQPLLQLDLNPQQSFRTQDKDTFSREKVMELARAGEGSDEDMVFLVRDTGPDNVNSYTSELDSYFRQGFVLTRFFYGKKDDRSETFMALERPEGSESEISEMQKAA